MDNIRIFYSYDPFKDENKNSVIKKESKIDTSKTNECNNTSDSNKKETNESIKTKICKYLDGIRIGDVDINFRTLHSLTFSRNMKLLHSIYEEVSKYSHYDILNVTSYICGRKLQMYYRLPEDKHEKIINTITDIVINKNIPDVSKVSHTKYVYNNINYQICKNMYDEKQKNNGYQLQNTFYYMILSVILQYSDDLELNERIYNQLELEYNNTTDMFLKMKIADMFHLSKTLERSRQGNVMLNEIRELERQFFITANDRNIARHRIKQKGIYQDTQSVHHTQLNKNNIVAAQELIKMMNEYEFDKEEVQIDLINHYNKYYKDVNTTYKRTFADDINNIEETLQRIDYETTVFESFTLCHLFSSLWKYINKHKYKLEMKTRLIEELLEMHLYCSTGHMARLLNVLHGFTENDETLNKIISVKITSEEQIKSSVYAFLTKELDKEENEAIMESMIDTENNKMFLTFVCKLMNEKINTLYNDYGKQDVEKHIMNIIIAYTGSNRISFVNSKFNVNEL